VDQLGEFVEISEEYKWEILQLHIWDKTTELLPLPIPTKRFSDLLMEHH
jgi:hypothetical protein